MKTTKLVALIIAVVGLGFGAYYLAKRPHVQPFSMPAKAGREERASIDAVLGRYNSFRTQSPNVVLQNVVSGSGMRAVVTSYFLGSTWLIKSVFDRPFSLSVLQVPSERGPLNYFPVTNVTVPETQAFVVYCLTEMNWHQAMTLEKIERVGGCVRHKKRGDMDVLSMYFPAAGFTAAKKEGATADEDAVVEYEIDGQGRIVRSRTTMGSLSMDADYKYVSFDETTVRVEMEKIHVKKAINSNVKYEDAIAEEAVQTFTNNLKKS